MAPEAAHEDRALAELAARYRLVMPRSPLHGGAGDLPGLGAGASLELLDLRDYVPGDDLRHLDWRAYARTDRLQTRLYRAEVAPVLDLVVDLSASMAVTERKWQALQALVYGFDVWAVQAGARPRCWSAGAGRLAEGEVLSVRREEGSYGSEQRLPPTGKLAPHGVRVVISDLLMRTEALEQVAALAEGAARLVIVQLLDPFERSPEALGPVELIDCESGVRRELTLDRAACLRYVRRFERLCEGWERAARAAGALFCPVIAAPPADMFRSSLLERGVIEVTA